MRMNTKKSSGSGNDYAVTGSLKEESTHYQTLAALLRHAACPEDEEKIRHILSESIPVTDKIQRIRKIDKNGGIEKNLHLLLRRKEDPEAQALSIPQEKPGSESRGDEIACADKTDGEDTLRKNLRERGIYTPKAVQHERKKLLVTAPSSGFFSFIFNEFWRIRAWAENTQILSFRYIPPGFTFSVHADKFFTEIVQKQALSLISALLFIEQNGWKILTKTEYNLTMIFKELILQINELTIEPGRQGETGLTSRMKRLEKNFILCRYNEDNINSIRKSCRTVLTVYGKFPETAKIIDESVNRLLTYTPGGPSLYAIILGINIMQVKRYISLNDVTNRGLEGLINNYSFDCPYEVQKNIDTFINLEIKELTETAEKYQAVLRLKEYIPYEGKIPAWDSLREFLSRYENPVRAREIFQENDTLTFAAVYAGALLSLADSFFQGEFSASGSHIRLFESDVYDPLFEHIRNIMLKIQKIVSKDHLIVISRSQLESLLRRMRTIQTAESHYELEIGETLAQLSRLFYDMGLSLAKMLKHSSEELSAQDKEVRLEDERSSRAVLPHSDKIIENIRMFTGDRVYDAVLLICKSLHQASAYLCNQEIDSILAHEQKIDKKFREHQKTLSRTVTPVRYESIMQKYREIIKI